MEMLTPMPTGYAPDAVAREIARLDGWLAEIMALREAGRPDLWESDNSTQFEAVFDSFAWYYTLARHWLSVPPFDGDAFVDGARDMVERIRALPLPPVPAGVIETGAPYETA